jgi:hypothetical protein
MYGRNHCPLNLNRHFLLVLNIKCNSLLHEIDIKDVVHDAMGRPDFLFL